jgi:hypothetical protein
MRRSGGIAPIIVMSSIQDTETLTHKKVVQGRTPSSGKSKIDMRGLS